MISPLHDPLVIRELTARDQDIIIEFSAFNSEVFKTKKDDIADSVLHDVAHENRILVGCFRSGTLVGTLTAHRWVNIPYYTLGHLKIDSRIKSPIFLKKASAELIKTITNTMEHEQRYTFFFASLLRGYAKKQLNQPRNINYLDTALKNYDVYVEAVFLKGQTINFFAYQKIIGKKVADTDIWIRKCCLKQKYRTHQI